MLNSTSQKILDKQDLINYFIGNSKNTEKIGLEYEKIGILNSNFQAIPFEDMEHLLEKLSEFEDYKRIFNNTFNKNIIGLKTYDKNISLEPGSQFEVSLFPQTKLKKLEEQINNHNELTKNIANDLGITWLGIGLQPLSTYNNIKIIPKKRYEIMTEYLPQVANLPLVMMRETAGIQTAVDFRDEQDAIEKLRLSLKLSPIVSAVFSNSPIRAGKLSGYKSFRAKSWTDTDNQRCGLVSKKLFEKNCTFSFADYIDILCDVQMIMVNQKGSQFAVNNFSFFDYMQKGYNGYFPTIKDFEMHASLYFTDTRLKKYLEIRNHDSQKSEFIMCIPAFWKGTMYNKEAREEINKILDNFTFEDFETLRQNTPKYGLDCQIGNKNLNELAKEIFNISYNSLKITDEEHYLEPILELIQAGITPADIVIRNFEGLWNGNIAKFIEYSRV